MAAAETGVSTVYNASGAIVSPPSPVTIPPPGTPPPGEPTGIVFNSTAGFLGDRFIFVTENGSVAGWSGGASAVTRVNNSAADAIYKGVALANRAGGNFLYATNFHAGKIEVFDSSYHAVALPGAFVDAAIPAGFAPFNIQNLGGKLYVTYAKQDAAKEDDVAGAGLGFVDVFDANGSLLRRLVSHGALNAPWGLALAPVDLGSFGNALFVGNFGDGHINVYNADTGAALGTLKDSSGHAIAIDGLWGLRFGDGTIGSKTQIFFTAGPDDETHGLFGRLEATL